MSKFFTFLFFILGFSVFGQGLINDGAYLVVSPSTAVTINGNTGHFTNQSAATTTVNGSLSLQGNFTNSAAFNSTSGTVTFNGSVSQTINGTTTPTSFYNLVENNSNGLSISLADVIVKNQLTMTQGLINLNSNEITLGTSASSPGTLSYTAGWMYGAGMFTRWFDTPSFTIADAKGHFPMGSSVYYHPFWFATSAPLTTAGTISITHNPSNSGYNGITTYNDASWGFDVIAISKSAWTISTGNSFNINPSAEIRFGGDGFVPFVWTDVNASLLTNTYGTHWAPTNVSGTYFEVNRTAIDFANLNKTWYIGTKDITNTPLPIDLLSFNATCHNGFVALDWATASETNNSYFTIERSLDGLSWKDIGTVAGAGNSNQLRYYNFSDESVFDQTVYYRLQQTDFDGNIKHFAAVSVSCGSDDEMQISVYPNPFTQEIALDISKFNFADAHITVFDIIGNKITERYVSDIPNQTIHATFDLSGLANGMYFIEVSAVGFAKNIKIVKN